MTGIENLAAFLHKQFNRFDENGPITKIKISHLPIGSSAGVLIDEISIPDPDTLRSVDDVQDLANECYKFCEDEALVLKGIQNFVIRVFRGDKKGGAKKIRVDGESEDEDESFNSEPANAKGLLSQLMRHNEAKERAFIAFTGQMLQSMNAQINSQAEIINRLTTDKFESLDMYQELASKKHEHEYEMRELEQKQRRENELLNNLKLLGPAVASKLTGQSVPALPGHDPTKTAVKNFLASLNPEQLVNISKQLTPAQQIALGTLGDLLPGNDEEEF